MGIGMVSYVIAVLYEELVLFPDKLLLSERDRIINEKCTAAAGIRMLFFKFFNYSYCAVGVDFLLAVLF